MKRIEASMNLDVMTVTGDSLKHNIESAQCYNDEVIRPLSQPLVDHGGIAILKGNLAPKGAVLKPSAATPELMNHRGKAVTFSTIEDFKARIDSPDLDIDKDSILVLKGAGPKGYPGMAEVGNLPLPKKLLEQGVRDMVRISDARMSGTAFGTVVLHVAPESAAGGVIGLVEDGDMIELNVEQRKLHLEVSDEELQQRRNRYEAEPSSITSGYQKLYIDHVLQADLGADLDFLVGCRGADVPRESH